MNDTAWVPIDEFKREWVRTLNGAYHYYLFPHRLYRIEKQFPSGIRLRRIF